MDDSGARQERLWTVQDLAGFLGVPVNTIYKWRSVGGGPPGFRIGRHVRYRRDDVTTWLADRRDDA